MDFFNAVLVWYSILLCLRILKKKDMNKLVWVLFFVINTNIYSNSLHPTIFNFSIKKDYPSRIYFQSSEAITASTTTGFIVSDNQIVGININSGKTAGHYFKVLSPFTYWHNNTIRYVGGSNFVDLDKNELGIFTLNYINNELEEPKANDKTYFVSVNGSDQNSGTSENQPIRTISKALENAVAGSTVWIKAGNYGKEFVVIRNTGKKDKPIKIIGYKNTPGDIESMYFSYGFSNQLNPNEMPLLRGEGDGKGIRTVKNSKYIIIRNIQLDGFKYGISSAGNFNVFDRVLVTDSSLFGIQIDGWKNSYNRIKNSIVVNAGNSLIRTFNDFNMIDNCKVYADANSRGSTDYYYSFYRGSNNIIKKSFAQRVGNLKHTGHGISLKGSEVPTEFNLVEDCQVDNISQAVELRHKEVRYNVVRNILFTGNKSHQAGGLSIRDNSSYNTIENCRMVGLLRGIRFTDNKGEQGIQAGGHHNKIINTVFEDCEINIVSSGFDSKALPSTYNEFLNCTFYNSDYMFSLNEDFNKTNRLTNCNIVKVKELVKKGGANLNIVQTYNNYYDGFSKSSGKGNISLSPGFKDEGNRNFQLKSSSKLIDAGTVLDQINCDIIGSNRPQGNSHDIGAYEFSAGEEQIVVNADAGMDVTICLDEEVTLTASGGESYLWSNGETTQSIAVSPNKTKYYSVEVSIGDDSDSDTVKVEVIRVKANAGSDVTINEGESITLTASGGESYLWSNGKTTESITINPKSTKRYTVKAYKNGCEDEDSIKVIVNPAELNNVIANAGKDVEICKGDAVILTASGGSEYEWNTGEKTQSITVSPEISKIYSVKVFEGSKFDFDDVEVFVTETKAFAGSDKIINPNESVVLTASGGDTYLWNNGETSESITVSPFETTIYSVTAFLNGCQDNDSVTVSVKIDNSQSVNQTNAFAGDDVTVCQGDSVTLIGFGGSEYSWSNGINSRDMTVTPEETTTYTLTAYDETGSTSTDSVTVTVENCDVSDDQQIQNSNFDTDFVVYPNPSSTELNVNLSDQKQELNIHLISATGSIVYRDIMDQSEAFHSKKIDMTRLSKGIYFVRLYNTNTSLVKKILVI